jgi:hypothetical protein
MNHLSPPNATHQYQSFLIRLWQDGEGTAWRGSAKHVATGHLYFFNSLEHLFVYLQTQTKKQEIA